MVTGAGFGPLLQFLVWSCVMKIRQVRVVETSKPGDAYREFKVFLNENGSDILGPYFAKRNAIVAGIKAAALFNAKLIIEEPVS
jgi:hypothetical protein